MNLRSFLVIMALALASLAGGAPALAGPDVAVKMYQQFAVGPAGITIEVPEGWVALPGAGGLDLALTGPEENGSKPVIAVNHLGESGEIELRDPAANEAAYRKQREAWLNENGGKLLAIIPLRTIKIGESSGFVVGNRSLLDNEESVETSYNIVCKGNAYNIMTEVPASVSKYAAEVERIVSSFDCVAGGDTASHSPTAAGQVGGVVSADGLPEKLRMSDAACPPTVPEIGKVAEKAPGVVDTPVASADGRYLVVNGCLRDTETGKPIVRTEGIIYFSPKSDFIVWPAGETKLGRLSLPDGKFGYVTLPAESANVWMSSDSRYAVVAKDNLKYDILDLVAGKIVLRGLESVPDFIPDKNQVLVRRNDDDTSFDKFDLTTGTKTATIDPMKGKPRRYDQYFSHLVMSPDGTTAVIFSYALRAELYGLVCDLASGSCTQVIHHLLEGDKDDKYQGMNAVFSDDGKQALLYSPDIRASLWDVSRKKLIWKADIRADEGRFPARFAGKGNFIVCPTKHGVAILSRADGKVLVEQDGEVIAIAPNGNYAAYDEDYKRVKLFSAPDGKARLTLPPDGEMGNSEDGRFLYVERASGQVEQWDLNLLTMKELKFAAPESIKPERPAVKPSLRGDGAGV